MDHSVEKAIDNLIHNTMWLMESRGLSKKEMAKMMGISISSLSKIEKGEFPMRLGSRILCKMHESFSVTSDELMCRRF